MVSIKVIAEGLSKQIEAAIAGKADKTQAHVLCQSVDSLIKLARLQIEMGAIDWSASPEAPVIEMESSVPVVKNISQNSPQVKTDEINLERKNAEKINLKVTAKTSGGQEIERQIRQFESRLGTATDQEKVFLTDRIALQRNKLKRLEPEWKG